MDSQDHQQYSFDSTLVSPVSSNYSLSPSDLWDGQFDDNSRQLALHLEHPDYSQHHADLYSTVNSARWTADYSPGSVSYNLPSLPALGSGAVDLALQANPSATVGDFLNTLPVHNIHTSPAMSQRRLSIDEQVRTPPLCDVMHSQRLGAVRTALTRLYPLLQANGTGEFDATKIAAFPAALLQLLDDEK